MKKIAMRPSLRYRISTLFKTKNDSEEDINSRNNHDGFFDKYILDPEACTLTKKGLGKIKKIVYLDQVQQIEAPNYTGSTWSSADGFNLIQETRNGHYETFKIPPIKDFDKLANLSRQLSTKAKLKAGRTQAPVYFAGGAPPGNYSSDPIFPEPDEPSGPVPFLIKFTWLVLLLVLTCDYLDWRHQIVGITAFIVVPSFSLLSSIRYRNLWHLLPFMIILGLIFL
jgi:hypothetical protein